MEFTQESAASLADKLEALDLTDGERAVLNAVFDAAADDEEVAGFATTSYTDAGNVTYLKSLGSIGAHKFGERWGPGPNAR